MMSIRRLALQATMGFALAGLAHSTASAQIVTATWNPAGSSPVLSIPQAPLNLSPQVTFNQITVSDFATVYLTPTGTPGTFALSESGFLPIQSYQLNGSTIQAPGLNNNAGATPYGIYGQFTATIPNFVCSSAGNCSGQYNNISFTLVGNPGDNATFGFSAATGLPTVVTGATFNLATGSLASCGAPGPLCQNLGALQASVPNSAVTTTFVPNPSEGGFFVNPPVTVNLNLFGSFTNSVTQFSCYSNTPSDPVCGSFQAGTLPIGVPAGVTEMFQIGRNTTGQVIGGGGSINLVAPIPEPASLILLGASLLGLGVLARRRRNRKA